MRRRGLTRRAFLRSTAGAAALAGLAPGELLAAAAAPAARRNEAITKAIPVSGERLPVVGMGSWLTFDVPDLETFRVSRTEVLRTFFAMGGRLVDSSPMYGRAERVIGDCLRRLDGDAALFAATKVWTPLKAAGRQQVVDSLKLWGVDRFPLLQIHNMLAWEDHLETLRALHGEGRVRYIGITTSHGRRHPEMEQVLRTQRFDFVQLSYSILDREVEARLLPLARDRGVAVIVNRPFRTGELFDRLARHPLPPFAADVPCRNWAELMLKFVVSHPAVTCAIPATSRVDHMIENMGAAYGRLPDEAMRQRLVRYVEGL